MALDVKLHSIEEYLANEISKNRVWECAVENLGHIHESKHF